MSLNDDVVDTRKEFPSTAEDEIVRSLIGKHIDGALESGSRFWGVLEGFDEK